ERQYTAVETRLRGEARCWHELTHDTKRAVADGLLGSEVRRLAREVVASGGLETGARAPSSTHHPPAVGEVGSGDDLLDALAELLACFPVYRSYLPAG